jgi:hypothetical protein
VGTVAQEAARLLDALGGWAATAGYAAPPPSRHTPDAGGETTGGEAPGDEARAGEAPGAEAPGRWEETPSSGHPAGHCEKCGAADGAGQAVVCRLCPVCQAIDLLRAVRPETVDRLADLAGVVATTLRGLADQRRQDSASGSSGHPSTREPRVQDIPVEDGTGS